MMAIYHGEPSTTTENENPRERAAKWRRVVRDTVEQPAFPRRSYFLTAAAWLVVAYDEHVREVTRGDPQFERICDRIEARGQAATSEDDRAQQLRRLGRAMCASIARGYNSTAPDFEVLSNASVSLQWVLEASGPAWLEAPEALWALLESQGMNHLAHTILAEIGPAAAPMFLEYFVDEFRATESEGYFGLPDVLGSLARGNSEVIALLLRAVETWQIHAAWSAARTLYPMGESARVYQETVPVLLRVTYSTEGQRRAAAALALGGVSRGLDVAVDRLLELTYDKHEDEEGYGGQIVAGVAITALGEIGRQPDRVVPRILELFDSFEEFDSDMGYEGSHARQVEALQGLGRAPELVIPVIIASLERRLNEGMDHWNDHDLLSLLRSYGSEAKSALPILQKLAAAEDDLIRQQAEALASEDDDYAADIDAGDADLQNKDSLIRKTIRTIRDAS